MFARLSAGRPAATPIGCLVLALAVSVIGLPSLTSAQTTPRQPTRVAADDDAPAATAPAATATVTGAKPQASPTASPTATAAAPAPIPAVAAPVAPAAVPLAAPPVPAPAAATDVRVVKTETKSDVSRLSGGLKALVLLGVIVIPIVVANLLAGALRMKDHVWRFFFVGFAVVAGAAATYLGWPPKLGVDLAGGVNLIYQIQPSAEMQSESTGAVLDKLVGTINRRINPGGVKEVMVRPFGTDSVEIIVPGADQDELDRLKKIMTSSGAMEFRILANHHKYQNIIDAATQQQQREDANRVPWSKIVTTERNGKQQEIARWVPVELTKAANYLGSTRYAVRTVPKGTGTEVQILCVKDQYDVTGGYLTSASPGLDDTGRHCVVFAFNSDGANRFSQLTGENVPDSARQTNELGIILDDYLQSAPSIQSTISDRGQITGDFTERDVKDLSEILTAGALPAALNKTPLSETLTSPSLGQDTIDAAIKAMTVAVAVVVVFMLIYYRFAGLVANIALVLNVLLTVAFMVMFNAAFTLAGLAGLALTVGMAVDANVLIYERMREELARGATLRMAIRNGFDRASVTIIDANVTTLITAIVLYIIGTDQIKGFAVALTVGLSWNLFTAITVSRLIFEVAERNRWVSNLKFLQIMGATNFDFIGKRYLCYTLSIIVLGAGLIGAVLRGSDLLNIDFTGGVSITTVFEKKPAGDIAEVRKRVEKVLPEATVQQLKEMPGFPDGAGYKIVTSDQDRAHVEKQLKEEFGTELAYHHMTPGKPELIGAAPATPGAPGPALTPPVKNNSSNDNSSNDAADGGDDELASACDQQTDQPAATATPTATAAGTGAKPQATGPTATATPATTTTTPVEEPATGSGLFTGGTFVTLKFQPAIVYDKLEGLVRGVLQPDKDVVGTPFLISAQGHEEGSSQPLPEWNLKIAAPPADAEATLAKLNARLADAPFFPSSENVGAAVAGGARQSAITAMVISLVMVMAYIWFRFQNLSFGIAAIVALVHDVMFTVGCLALSKWVAPYLGFALVDPFKIDLTIVAAILTIIGYSLNDTIVIFDRIREVRGKSANISAELINTCVNQTLSRTILTSLTVFMVVVVLYIWGGPGIHGFAFALVVGTLSGTYSTIYVASPVLLWLHQRSKAHAAAPQAAAHAS